MYVLFWEIWYLIILRWCWVCEYFCWYRDCDMLRIWIMVMRDFFFFFCMLNLYLEFFGLDGFICIWIWWWWLSFVVVYNFIFYCGIGDVYFRVGGYVGIFISYFWEFYKKKIVYIYIYYWMLLKFLSNSIIL